MGRKVNKRNFYNEISEAISSYERGVYAAYPIRWITDRIAWCARFKKMTAVEIAELSDRVIAIMPIAKFYN